MQGLIAIFFLPLMALNFFGGIVGVIWLIVLGEWAALAVALGALILGPIVCSLALMPGLLVTAPALAMYSRGGIPRIASYPLMLVGLTWTFVVVSAWALWWFAYYLGLGAASAIVPMLLIAYGVATGPWVYMAQKEAQGGSGHAMATAFFLQIACAIVLVMLAFLGARPETALITFLSVMMLALVLNVVMFIVMAASASSSNSDY